MSDGDGRAYRVRQTEGGKVQGASEYSDDLFVIELAAFALTEQGIPNIVEHRVGGGYRAWPPDQIITCEQAARAGHGRFVQTGNAKTAGFYMLEPSAIGYLNPPRDRR